MTQRHTARLGRFVADRFTPHIYASYGVLWALALEGSAELLSGARPSWVPTWRTAARLVTVVLVLLFLRMLDEQKDLDYDRRHNPDRPLVTGAISRAELRWSMTGVGILVLALNIPLSWLSVALVAVDLGYGLGLAGLERMSARLRDGVLANLAMAYPVQIGLGCYLYWSLASVGEIRPDWRVLPLLLVFAGTFLQFEFARKTRWRHEPGARLYSGVLGPVRSAVWSLGLAGAAAALAVLLFRPVSPLGWLPGPLVACPAVGAARFFGRRADGGLLLPAMCFVVGNFGCLLLVAVVGRTGG
jgi:4-hydroxybenzoate polyprenyltransferase